MQMSTPGRRTMWTGGFAVLVMTLAACSGTPPQGPAPSQPAVIGISAVSTDHSVAVRDLFIPDPGAAGYPAGASVPLILQVWNNTNAAVSLTGAAVTGGRSATLIDAKSTATVPVTTFDLPIGPGTSVGLNQQSGRFLQLQCAAGVLRAGTGLPMTFTFSNGASIATNVPIGQSVAPAAGASADPSAGGADLATC